MSMRTADPTEYAPVTSGVGQVPTGVESSETYSVIDRHTTVDGTFQANRDLRIEGTVKGNIECQGTLFVAQGANVTAKVVAENVTVAGDLNGEVNCRGRLQIMPSGRLRGKVATQSLVVNEGAFYEGQLEMPSVDNRVSAGPSPRPIPSTGGSGGGSPVQIPTQQQAPPRPAPQAPPAEGQAGSKTFIRRFGGPETPWDGEGQERPEQDGGPDEGENR